MSSETNKKKNAACCDSGDFQGMSEMMSKCFSGENTSFDCSAMMESSSSWTSPT